MGDYPGLSRKGSKQMMIWLNALATLFLYSGNGEAVESRETPVVIEETATSARGYVVVESVEDEIVVIETDHGEVCVPRELFPELVIHEGMVLEWRVADEERYRRLEEAQERIHRMQSLNIPSSDASTDTSD